MHSPTARRWAALIDQADRSNLTRREFAAKVGVNPNTLAWWKWRLKRRPAERAATRFVELVEVEVEVSPPRGTVRVELRGDVVIEVDHDTDLDLLRDVVDALC